MSEGLSLPLASITRLMKMALPESFNISAEVRTVISKCTALFMLYLINAGDHVRRRTKRSTITAEDVIIALDEINFTQFVEPINVFLTLLRSQNTERRAKMKAKSGKGGEEYLLLEPSAKKARTEEGLDAME